MDILQGDGYDLYSYVVCDKIVKKQKFSFNRVKRGLYYIRNIGRVIEFKDNFRIKNDDMCLQKVISKKYIGKIDKVATW